MLATLARRFGDLDLAEEAVQEAFEAAQRRWPVDGVPDRPGAWLTTTAYRKAISSLRRRRSTDDLASAEPGDTPWKDHMDPSGDDLSSDLFGLMLAYCHPAINDDARVALTLRHVAGLGVAEIARVLLVSEQALAKRLVRARAKIKDAGISFEVPSGRDLDARIEDVRTVIYLVFTEGYLSATSGPAVREELCEEAIWLARQLQRVRPGGAETIGLLALMRLHHGRSRARVDADGTLVTLDSQDRRRWDAAAVEEAKALLATTGRDGLGPYQVEAAIALLHVATDPPDWSSIADLYGVLSRLAPSPVTDVNRALAVGRADGPAAGLAVLGPVLASRRLDAYASLHAVHAELLGAAGRHAEAAGAWQRGIDVAATPAQRSAMDRRTPEFHDRLS